jgi:hypothetical protein
MKNKCKVPNISAIDNNVQSLLRLGEFYFVVKQEDILEEKGLGGGLIYASVRRRYYSKMAACMLSSRRKHQVDGLGLKE